MSARLLGTLILTFAAAAASLGLLASLGPDWTQFEPASCLATRCFCETPRTDALILQPSNSWSSFGFVIIGIWITLTNSRRSNNPATAFAGLPAVWFGLTAIVIGVGSFLLHATLTLWGQFFDVLGMYLTSAFLIAYAVHRWRGLSDSLSISLYLALCAVLIGFLVTIPETRRWLFAVVLIAAIVIELWLARPLRSQVDTRWFLIGMALQATAFAIWILDLSGIWCDGTNLIQGHSVWHLLNTAALYSNYLYYRSEKARP